MQSRAFLYQKESANTTQLNLIVTPKSTPLHLNTVLNLTFIKLVCTPPTFFKSYYIYGN